MVLASASRHAVLGLGLICATLASARASDGHGEVSLEAAARAFDDAALRINTTPATELARWTSPIYLVITGTEGMGAHAAEAEASIRAIAAVAGVSVTRVPQTDPRANFIVRAGGTPDGRPSCRSSIDWTADGSMKRVEIRVNVNSRQRITRCLNHEAMHGFGFRGHPHASFSVLSYKYADQAQLTAGDRVMIETLYDPRLRPGMAPAAASTLACTIMAAKLQATPEAMAAVCGSNRDGTTRPALMVLGTRPGTAPRHIP